MIHEIRIIICRSCATKAKLKKEIELNTLDFVVGHNLEYTLQTCNHIMTTKQSETI